jgi:hypothetical protein
MKDEMACDGSRVLNYVTIYELPNEWRDFDLQSEIPRARGGFLPFAPKLFPYFLLFGFSGS